jgi:hypothetical protein
MGAGAGAGGEERTRGGMSTLGSGAAVGLGVEVRVMVGGETEGFLFGTRRNITMTRAVFLFSGRLELAGRQGDSVMLMFNSSLHPRSVSLRLSLCMYHWQGHVVHDVA